MQAIQKILKQPVRIRVACFIADGEPDAMGYSHQKSRVHIPKPEVQVTRNYDHTQVLGVATLSWEDKTLMADMTITVPFPIELLDEMTPCAGGYILEVEEIKSAFDPNLSVKLATCQITSLGLCLSRNADPRVKSIREQRESH